MAQRIALGTLAIVVIAGLVGSDALLAREPPFLSGLLTRGSLIPCALAVISVIACLELAALFGRIGIVPARRWAVGCCLALVLAPWLSAAGVLGEAPTDLEAVHLQMALVAAALLGAAFIGVFSRDVSAGLANVSATWLLIGYAGFLPSFLVLLRCDSHRPQIVGEHGAWIILAVILVCKTSDIGAYFAGSWFGRHRLMPRVSPGKSVEGMVGGVLMSCTVSLLFLYLHRSTLPTEDPSFQTGYRDLAHCMTIMYHNMTFSQAFCFGIVMSFVGQLGDLVESVFKRSAQAKDSGRVLPGFGGILDMIDSPVVTAPLAWFLLTRVWAVV